MPIKVTRIPSIAPHSDWKIVLAEKHLSTGLMKQTQALAIVEGTKSDCVARDRQKTLSPGCGKKIQQLYCDHALDDSDASRFCSSSREDCLRQKLLDARLSLERDFWNERKTEIKEHDQLQKTHKNFMDCCLSMNQGKGILWARRASFSRHKEILILSSGYLEIRKCYNPCVRQIRFCIRSSSTFFRWCGRSRGTRILNWLLYLAFTT